MRRYSDKNGGLVVEKTDVTDKSNVSNKKVSTTVSLSASEIIDTMQSYQTGNFSVLDSSSKGVCAICGNQTAAKNRHICVECWKQNKDNIIDGLKTAVKDVELKIE